MNVSKRVHLETIMKVETKRAKYRLEYCIIDLSLMDARTCPSCTALSSQ